MRTGGMVLVILGVLGVIAPVLYDLLVRHDVFRPGPKSAISIIVGVVLVVLGLTMMKGKK